MALFTNQEYQVFLTGRCDASAIVELEKCQATFAADHQAMYAGSYPDITNERWAGELCCGLLRMYMDNGVIVLRAESIETGQVAGYISCSLFPRSSVPTASLDSQVRGVSGDNTSTPVSSQNAAVPWSVDGLQSINDENVEESSCPRGKFDAPDDGANEDIPHAKINHIFVLPAHRAKGLGRLLFNGLVSHLENVAPEAAIDLQIVSVELNTQAMQWYWRLGFVLVELYLEELEMKTCKYPVIYARMRRHREIQYVPKGQFFGDKVCGEKLIVLPPIVPSKAAEPLQNRAWSDSVPADLDFSLPASLVAHYDAISGCHQLEDGRSIDLTDAYSRGQIRFERPLHAVVASTGETGQDSRQGATQGTWVPVSPCESLWVPGQDQSHCTGIPKSAREKEAESISPGAKPSHGVCPPGDSGKSSNGGHLKWNGQCWVFVSDKEAKKTARSLQRVFPKTKAAKAVAKTSAAAKRTPKKTATKTALKKTALKQKD